MIFQLNIDTDNAAFGDSQNERDVETARILRWVADRVEEGRDFSYFQMLFDINGNDVGRAAFKEEGY